MRSKARVGALFLAVATTMLVGCAAREQPPLASASPAPINTANAADELWSAVTNRFPDAVRPEAQLVRFATPAEMPALQAECLNQQGFPSAVTTPDGGLLVDGVPEEQQEALAIAGYVCAVNYQIDPQYTDPLSTDELTALYSYFKDELIPCLENEGQAVSDAPSLETFIDTYEQTGWTPYIDVVPGTQDEWYAINASCPPWPDGFYG